MRNVQRGAAWLLFFIASTATWAQNTAEISGSVADASGAIVVGALVKVTNTDTAAVRSTTSASDGSYAFPALPIGTYRLDVSKDGFKSFSQSGIAVQVGTTPKLPVTLQVGSSAQTVEVNANAAMVETQSTGVGTVIQPEQIVDLPLNGRQATQLIALAGGAVDTTGAAETVSLGGLVFTLDYPGAVAISIAGNQPNATNYLLDGSANMDYRTNVGAPMPFPDALSEFRVNSSSVPANEGSRPGGVVNSETRSGTNSFHGNLFEFVRNGAVNAVPATFQNPSGTTPAPIPDNLKRNQFGGTIGGPIRRNKLFFFYGFQETTQRQNLPPSSATIPTAATLRGDFTVFNSPACNGGTQRHLATVIPATGSIPAQQLTISDNIMNPVWLNTPAAKMAAQLASLLPAPDDPNCGLITAAQTRASGEYQQVGRVDWQRTQSDTIFGRYFIGNFTQPTPYFPDSALKLFASRDIGLNDRVQNASFGDTHIVSPSMISSFRVYFSRTVAQRVSDSHIPTLCSIGAAYNANFTCMNPIPQINIFGNNIPGNLGWAFENNYGISENIGWQIHSHNLQIGFSVQKIEMNGWGTFNTNPLPAYTTGTVATTSTAAGCAPAAPPCFTVSSGNSWSGIALGDFVSGNVSSFSQGHGQLSRDFQHMPSGYVQDNWKISQRLQFNLGVRWDPFLPSSSKYRLAADFSLPAFEAGQASKVYPNAPPGVTFPGDPGFNGLSDVNAHAYDFSPRFGFVYDRTGKGTETIRGGYGLFWETSTMWNTQTIVQNPPWGSSVSLIPAPVNLAGASQGGGLTNVFFGQPNGNPFPVVTNPPSTYQFPTPTVANGTPVSTGTSWAFEDQNIKPTYVQEWNLSWQRQVAANWLVSASYIGSKTTHLWVGVTMNPDVIVLPSMTSAQYPGIVSASQVSADGSTGSCTLLYAGAPVTLNPCNSAGAASTMARRFLSLLSPGPRGGGMFGGTSSGVNMAESVGNGFYNGMLLSMQHRLSHGFSASANYTFSHCLDTAEIGQDLGNTLQNPANPRGNWGSCAFDRRHLVNVSLIAQGPKFSSHLANGILGDWNVSGVFTAASGAPFTVTPTSTNYTLTGVGNDYPNVYGDPFTGGDVAANPTLTAAQRAACPTVVHTWTNWFNPCAFGNSTVPGQYGNEARNSLVGPGRWNLDTALWRTFRLKEKYRMDLRAEAFNVFNHPALGAPTTALNNATPGRISSDQSTPRQLQGAIKFTF